MDSHLLPWLFANALTTLINGVVLGFLAHRESNRALGWWSLAWLSGTLAVLVSGSVEPKLPTTLDVIALAAVNLASAVAFLKGAAAFAGRAMSRRWWIALAVATAAGLLLGRFVGLAAAMAPMVLFYCAGTSMTGVSVWRAAPNRYGARVVGVTLILIAIHVLDYPLTVEHPAFAPWGYLLMVVLESVAALGMLMLHYEDARVRWRESERALSTARRTEALGRVAGGVAHDFNNILTVIQGHLELLDRDDPKSVEESARVIEAAVGQATRLTSQLLAFGRRAVLQPQAIDLREVVETTVHLLGRLVPENITLHFHADRERYPTSADRSLLEQIILNLVSNARDALVDGGQIEVELRQIEVPRPGVSLRVIDDGPGISEEVLERLFEPFFTTKPVEQGTGLGLASVEGAVAQLGGSIQVHSVVGEGSTFEVFLPQLPAQVTPAVALERSASSQAFGRILIVDDDARVRAVAERILAQHGHAVRCASDGVMALSICEEEVFDVVLTDVVMPRMGGIALARALETRSPQTRVIFTSGYPAEDADALTSAAFFPKPFTRSALLDYVARALDEGRAASLESESV